MLDIHKFLKNFSFENDRKTVVESINISGLNIPVYVNEYWTSKQRQANSIHEISYRACFKPQLPRFFIDIFTKEGDTVYDPFNGRGTTVIEAALLNRNIIANDINPLSIIFSEARLHIPEINEIEKRLDEIDIDFTLISDIDLSMFYQKNTLSEILTLKKYLSQKKGNSSEDFIDKWIRMVATNRLTGHSSGFFSVYTLPPNQAVSSKRQIEINKNRNQFPEYRNIKKLIITKSKSLLKQIADDEKIALLKAKKYAVFLSKDSRQTPEIENESVQLTVTSPPFLDVVQYAEDNWLRCWFNNIDVKQIEKNITMSKTVEQWQAIMQDVFVELFRISKKGAYIAFEVGEVKSGKLNLDEYVVNLGKNAGFNCEGIVINEQIFTKTANIWGISNNSKGTNSNRIVLFRK
jgi:DNA modification methylase